MGEDGAVRSGRHHAGGGGVRGAGVGGGGGGAIAVADAARHGRAEETAGY